MIILLSAGTATTALPKTAGCSSFSYTFHNQYTNACASPQGECRTPRDSTVAETTMQRIASIDIGSQTIRLLIADCDAESLYPLERDREIVRLGAGMQAAGLLQPDRIEHAAACIHRFCGRARTQGADIILAVATACVRQARNRRAFLDSVQQTCGLVPEVIDGRREALLASAGVQAAIDCTADSSVIIDIGGGSTELSFLASGLFQKSLSLPLGVIAPTELFLRADPPSQTDSAAMRSWIQKKLTCLPAHTGQTSCRPAPVLIATAGTATTLAAMDLGLDIYLPARINGHILSQAAISRLFDDMIAKPLHLRCRLPGLEPGRAAVIIPGCLILQHLMQYFGTDTCTASDAGLLEGSIIEHAALKKIIEKT